MSQAKVKYICTAYIKRRFGFDGYNPKHWLREVDVLKGNVVSKEELHQAYLDGELGFARVAYGERLLYLFEFQTWLQKRCDKD